MASSVGYKVEGKSQPASEAMAIKMAASKDSAVGSFRSPRTGKVRAWEWWCWFGFGHG